MRSIISYQNLQYFFYLFSNWITTITCSRTSDCKNQLQGDKRHAQTASPMFFKLSIWPVLVAILHTYFSASTYVSSMVQIAEFYSFLSIRWYYRIVYLRSPSTPTAWNPLPFLSTFNGCCFFVYDTGIRPCLAKLKFSKFALLVYNNNKSIYLLKPTDKHFGL